MIAPTSGKQCDLSSRSSLLCLFIHFAAIFHIFRHCRQQPRQAQRNIRNVTEAWNPTIIELEIPETGRV